VGEGSATGLLFAIGNLFGFFLGMFLSLIVQGETKAQTAGGIGFCFGVFLIGLALAYFMNENLNRSTFEKESSERRKSGDISQRSSLLSVSSDRSSEIAKPLLGDRQV
jgi:hypothetical protein